MNNYINDYVAFKFAMDEEVNVTGTDIVGKIVEQRHNVKVNGKERTVEVTYLVRSSSSGYSSSYPEEKLRYPDELSFKDQYAVYYNFIDMYLGVDHELVEYYRGKMNKLVEDNKKVKTK